MSDADPGGAPQAEIQRHSLLGALAGLLVGTGGALLLFLYGLVAAGTRAPFLVIVACTLLGAVWGRWAPARSRGEPVLPGEPVADQRMRQAMAENLAVIDRAGTTPTPPPEIPDLEPPGPDDPTDWHHR